MRANTYTFSLTALPLISLSLFGATPTDTVEFPLPIAYENSAEHSWQHKEVLETRVLADMEAAGQVKANGSNILEVRSEISKEKKRFGESSLKVTAQIKDGEFDTLNGATFVGYQAKGGAEDWSDYTRVSIWVYPDVPFEAPGRRDINFKFIIGLPDHEWEVDEANFHSMVAENEKWKQLIWEIPHYDLSKITGITLAYDILGFEGTEADQTIDIYYDQLELQKVEPDYISGWQVAPGEIAFSHSGYLPGSQKQAFASDLSAKTFSLIDVHTGESEFSAPVQSIENTHGNFQILDFSSVSKPGIYMIQSGDRATRSFTISGEAWDSSILKTINFFYSLRCGTAIEGIHPVCHTDWICTHEDQTLLINGGWHDAGDLTQSIERTGRSLFGMLNLAKTMQDQEANPSYMPYLLEEAKWGLDWVLKTTFHNGFRAEGGKMGPYTDNIIGSKDDKHNRNKVYDKPEHFFTCVTNEALAYQVFKDSDPALAERSLDMAKEDWEFARAQFNKGLQYQGMGKLGVATQATAELYAATGEQKYVDAAIEYANALIQTITDSFLEGTDTPIAGQFTKSPNSDDFLYFSHDSVVDSAVCAVARMCELLPEAKEWINWYAYLVLYADYNVDPLSNYFAPYNTIPMGVYYKGQAAKDISQWLDDPRWSQWVEPQLASATPIGGKYLTRFFPVQVGAVHRGNTNIQLSFANGLAAAAQVRNQPAHIELAQDQLRWVVGLNPFNRSLMFGEGYGFKPLYTEKSGDIAGALPVGLAWKDNSDTPYWPSSAYPVSKEVWVSPAGRWIWTLSHVLKQVAAPKSTLSLHAEQDGDQIQLRGKSAQSGTARMLTWNLKLNSPSEQAIVSKNETNWSAQIIDANKPWVAVIQDVADPATSAEAFGSIEQ